ncbi:MAG: glycosyltransferase family 39 protein [Actinobacteria bacterium]|nr:glycosyltransferase family 39 protein [Actinomycetota bacterium]
MDSRIVAGAEPTTSIETRDSRASSHADAARPWRPWRLFAVLLLLLTVLHTAGFKVDVFNSDETFLATQGQVLNHGGSLYHDAVDRKPPLVPYLYAVTFRVFGTSGLWTVRLLAIIAAALTAWLVAIEARRRYGDRAAWVAGILCALGSLLFVPQDGQAANFEIFMLPAMMAGFVLARRKQTVASGVALAVATLAKQTAAATLLPVIFIVAKLRGRRGVRDTLAGFVVPIAIVALLVGPGQLLFWAVLGNGSYLEAKSASMFVVWRFLQKTGSYVGANMPLLLPLPFAWRSRRENADLWLWLLSAAISVAIGFRFFGHYYLQLLPPLVLLTTGVLVRKHAGITIATIAFAAVVATGLSVAAFWADQLDSEPAYAQTSSFLMRHTTPQDRILVWGHLPELYWASGREPATRFITTGFLTGHWGGRPPQAVSPDLATPGAWKEFYRDMAAHPPEYILDTSNANIRGSQYYRLTNYPSLAGVVATYYRYVRSIDKIDVYQLNADSPTVSRQFEDVEAPG